MVYRVHAYGAPADEEEFKHTERCWLVHAEDISSKYLVSIVGAQVRTSEWMKDGVDLRVGNGSNSTWVLEYCIRPPEIQTLKDLMTKVSMISFVTVEYEWLTVVSSSRSSTIHPTPDWVRRREYDDAQWSVCRVDDVVLEVSRQWWLVRIPSYLDYHDSSWWKRLTKRKPVLDMSKYLIDETEFQSVNQGK